MLPTAIGSFLLSPLHSPHPFLKPDDAFLEAVADVVSPLAVFDDFAFLFSLREEVGKFFVVQLEIAHLQPAVFGGTHFEYLPQDARNDPRELFDSQNGVSLPRAGLSVCQDRHVPAMLITLDKSVSDVPLVQLLRGCVFAYYLLKRELLVDLFVQRGPRGLI